MRNYRNYQRQIKRVTLKFIEFAQNRQCTYTTANIAINAFRKIVWANPLQIATLYANQNSLFIEMVSPRGMVCLEFRGRAITYRYEIKNKSHEKQMFNHGNYEIYDQLTEVINRLY